MGSRATLQGRVVGSLRTATRERLVFRKTGGAGGRGKEGEERGGGGEGEKGERGGEGRGGKERGRGRNCGDSS